MGSYVNNTMKLNIPHGPPLQLINCEFTPGCDFLKNREIKYNSKLLLTLSESSKSQVNRGTCSR